MIEFTTPTVTSANGSSTVVGASPRCVWRYTPSTFWMRMAFVVVLPQSVARITRMSWGSIFGMRFTGLRDGVFLLGPVAAGLVLLVTALSFQRFNPATDVSDRPALFQEPRYILKFAFIHNDRREWLDQTHELCGNIIQRTTHLKGKYRRGG